MPEPAAGDGVAGRACSPREGSAEAVPASRRGGVRARRALSAAALRVRGGAAPVSFGVGAPPLRARAIRFSWEVICGSTRDAGVRVARTGGGQTLGATGAGCDDAARTSARDAWDAAAVGAERRSGDPALGVESSWLAPTPVRRTSQPNTATGMAKPAATSAVRCHRRAVELRVSAGSASVSSGTRDTARASRSSGSEMGGCSCGSVPPDAALSIHWAHAGSPTGSGSAGSAIPSASAVHKSA